MRTNPATPLLLVAAVAVPAMAQTPERKPTPAPEPAVTSPVYVYLDDILGAKVTMAPGAEARREAAEDNETAKRPTGEVKDLLVERGTGTLDVAVVSFGGFLGIGDKIVALPIRLMHWNPEKKCFDLSANEDQLKSLPAFDLSAARKSGLDKEIVVIRGNWTKVGFPEATVVRSQATTAEASASGREAPGEAPAVVKGTTFTSLAVHYSCASEIDDPPVYALTEKFGKITKCIVDRSGGVLAFCVVSHGGALGMGDTEYLIPFREMRLCRKGSDDIICLDRSVEEMKSSAVKYVKPKDGVVDPVAASRASARRSDG
jgi:hypothetical protein